MRIKKQLICPFCKKIIIADLDYAEDKIKLDKFIECPYCRGIFTNPYASRNI